jgi:hypothetical protein
MSGWIKFDKEMGDDPRLLQAAAQLGKVYTIARASGSDLSAVDRLAFACNAVTGALVTLWGYADMHIRDDDTLPMTQETLDAMVGIEGFFAIMPRDWIDELDDGTIVLPGYCKKNSLIAKKNAVVKSNARVAAFRARKKVNGNGHGRTLPRRYSTVSKVVDRDQEGDLKNKKPPIPPFDPVTIPGLDLEAWNAWVEYRKKRKPAIKRISMQAAAQELAAFGEAQMAVVQHSIAHGYQGLIPPKNTNGTHSRQGRMTYDEATAGLHDVE